MPPVDPVAEQLMRFLPFVAFLYGTMAGSFANVCIWRMPREESVVTPRSRCPGCGAPIVWYDNIPLVSYLILGGACRHCRGRISWRYPLVEALTGFLWAAVTWRLVALGMHWTVVLVHVALMTALVIITFIDIDHRIIPNEITYAGMILAPALSFLLPGLHSFGGEATRAGALVQSLLGMAAGGGSIWALGAVGSWVFRKEAMGFGDVKLMAMLGGLLGWKLVLVVFFVAPCFGSVVGIVHRIVTGDRYIPYGPFLALAAAIAVLFPVELLHGVDRYLEVFGFMGRALVGRG